MGTVGLSFGSPTSGTGFNVSQTVAAIVGNLQNVETPWKTQLSTLESQDAVISNLGTLFSNVSNDMSQLTDFEGVLAQKTGSSSDTNVLELTSASSSATAGTHTVVVQSLAETSSGYLDEIPTANAGDTLGGSLTIGSQTFNMTQLSDPTLSGLASAINASNAGVTANVLTDASGSYLSLVSNTSGAAGQMTVTSNITDTNLESTSNPNGVLNYNDKVNGANAQLTIDGVPLQSASNTVTNLIPGVTFQLLAPSPTTGSGSSSTQETVQVVIGNDNTSVESTVNQFVSDYNSLVSAVNAQEGNTSSGTPEPLFGSPTLSLLQQQLLSGINTTNPNGYLTSVSSEAGVTLSGSMTIQVGNGTAETIQIGPQPSGGAAANTIYTGSGSGYNTLSGLVDAINAADASTSVTYTAASGGDSGTMTASSSAQLTGTLTLQTANGGSETIYLGPSSSAPAGDLATGTSNNTLDSLASFISGNSTLSGLGISASSADSNGTSTMTLTSTNGALTVTSDVDIPGLGVTAGVSTQNGQSSLTLASQTAGSSGDLTVTSSIVASTPAALSYTDSGYTSTTADSGTVGEVKTSTDALSGSLTIQAGSGTAQTVNMSDVQSAEGGDTVADLASYITANTATLGVKASTVTNSDGTVSLSLLSNNVGSAGALSVTSNLADTTNSAQATLNYTNSSDVGSLTSLGISVNNDGSLTFDASSLDALLNSDYSGVQNFFQGVSSWGQTFSTMLTNAGSSSPTGVLALASSSNSTIESTLNAEITKENSTISAEQSSLTTELNQANQTLQEIPTQLDGINELYSAITGYSQQNG